MEYTISDLAKEFHISPRTIRFYEEKGLISPRRTSGNQRSYSRRDRTRLLLILRGKQLGWKLDDMESILSLSDVDPEHTVQMEKAMEIGMNHMDKVNKQIFELLALKKDLLTYGDKIVSRFKELEKPKKDWEQQLDRERSSLEKMYEATKK